MTVFQPQGAVVGYSDADNVYPATIVGSGAQWGDSDPSTYASFMGKDSIGGFGGRLSAAKSLFDDGTFSALVGHTTPLRVRVAVKYANINTADFIGSGSGNLGVGDDSAVNFAWQSVQMSDLVEGDWTYSPWVTCDETGNWIGDPTTLGMSVMGTANDLFAATGLFFFALGTGTPGTDSTHCYDALEVMVEVETMAYATVPPDSGSKVIEYTAGSTGPVTVFSAVTQLDLHPSSVDLHGSAVMSLIGGSTALSDGSDATYLKCTNLDAIAPGQAATTTFSALALPPGAAYPDDDFSDGYFKGEPGIVKTWITGRYQQVSGSTSGRPDFIDPISPGVDVSMHRFAALADGLVDTDGDSTQYTLVLDPAYFTSPFTWEVYIAHDANGVCDFRIYDVTFHVRYVVPTTAPAPPNQIRLLGPSSPAQGDSGRHRGKFAVDPGTKTFSGRLKIGSTDTTFWAVPVVEAYSISPDGTTVTLIGSSPLPAKTVVAAPQWNEINIFGDLPDAATHYSIRIDMFSDAGLSQYLPEGTKVYYDSIFVPDGGLDLRDDQQPYLDGDQPGAIWEGTPENSTSIYGSPPPPAGPTIKVYWHDGSTNGTAMWEATTGVIKWLVPTDPALPDLPVTGGTLDSNSIGLGSFEVLGDGRVASSLGTGIAETVMVFNSDLNPASAEYWIDEATPEDRSGVPSTMNPADFNSVYDPVLDALWMPRVRNYDSGTGDVDTWTAYRASDGTVLSSEARGLGAWDFVSEANSFNAPQYSRCFRSGNFLYRTDEDGWVDRYQIGGGSWDVTSINGATAGEFVTLAGVLNDGTLIFVWSSSATNTIEFRSFASIDWVPISSSSATIGAATKLADLTPSRTWALPDFALGNTGASATVQIINDVAYYFRQGPSYVTDHASEFVAHDLNADSVTILFVAPEQFLLADGTPTTSGDPALVYDVDNPGWGIAVSSTVV